MYLLYKLVFDFIIPVYQTSRSLKDKMGEMQRKMNEQATKQQANQQHSTAKEAEPQGDKHEYIDYEEVK